MRSENFLKPFQIRSDDFENEINLSIQHVAFTDFGNRCNMLFKQRQILLGLTSQGNHRKYRNGVAETRGIEVGMISMNESGFFKCPDPAQARRRGKPNPFGEFNICHPTILL